MANNGWRTVSIDEIKATHKLSIAIGPFGSRLKADSYTKSGIPIIRGNNLTSTKYFTNEFVYVPESKANELASSVVYADDLVFPHRGNIGAVGIVPNDQPRYLLSTSLMKLTVDKKKADPTFMFYYFTSAIGKHELLKNASQAGTPGIATPLSSLRGIKLLLPPLDEQRRIAHILGTLDDKIELNRQLNATLEQMARALFQSWFVDFDPVRAKSSGEPEESICRRLGLTPELLALFPPELEESVLGQIPAGWSIVSLGQLIELAYGKALKEEQRKPGSIAVYGSKGSIGWHNESLVTGPGIVVGRKGNAGAVTWTQTDFFPIDTTFYVIPKREIGLPYLFFCLDFHNLPALGADSAVPGLNRNMVYASKQVIPPVELALEFERLASALFTQAHQLSEESRTLTALRDELLPKLISGELPVMNSYDEAATGGV